MKKALSVGFIFALIVAMTSTTALAAERSVSNPALFADTSGHWSEKQARRWLEEGLVQGDQNGNANLDHSLTYAEIATILQRLLGIHYAEDSSQLSEKEPDFWYSDAIAACKFYGMIQGNLNGDLDPERTLSRAEAFVIFARGLGIEPAENPDLSGFTDGEQVPPWAAGYLAALVERGYLSGTPLQGGRSLSWEGKLDRGSLFAFLDQTISDYITQPGDYELSASDKLVVIHSSDEGEIHVTGRAAGIVISQGNHSSVAGSLSSPQLIQNSKSRLTLEKGSNVENLICNEGSEIHNQGKVEKLTANISQIKLSGQEPGQIVLGTGVQSPVNSSKQENSNSGSGNFGSNVSGSGSSGSSSSSSSSSGSEPSSPGQNVQAQEQQVTVKFYPGEGADPVADWILVNANFAQTALPDPTKTGYRLAGWYGAANVSGEAYTFASLKTAVEQANSGTTIELYAKWEPRNYTVKYNVEWSETIPAYVFDGDYALPASPPGENGQTFLGWFTAEEDGVLLTAENMKQEMRNMAVGSTQGTITLYARFSAPVLPETRTVTVTFQPNNGEETFSWTVIDGVCTQTALPTPSKTGLVFNGWLDGDKKYTLEDLKTVLSTAADGTNLTLTADWTEKSLQVRLNTGGGSIKGRTWTEKFSEEGTSFYQLSPTWTEAENLTLPTPTFLGHAFKYWEKGETNYLAGQSLRELFTEEAVTALELTAKYSAVEYTVQFELSEHGKAGESVAAKKFTVEDSDFAFPTPTGAEGYTFDGWYYDSAPIETLDDLYGIVLILKNSTTITLTAHWN